jgi:hypothetical protein
VVVEAAMSTERKLERTTIALAVISVALFAFIVFVEQHTLSSGELAARRGQLIQTFVRDRVTKLVLERDEADGGRIVLERHREDDDELGEWQLTAPVAWPADPDATDSLLGALEWARPRRTLEGVTAEDRARFGLDEPRLRASFTVADREIPIAVGGEDPQGGGSYVALDDPSVAYVVGADVVEALEHDAEHFRDHELFTRIGTSRAAKLRIAREGAAIVVERRGERFVLTAPIEGHAGDGAVRNLLRVLSDLRATRFVEDAPEDDARFGLREPALTIALDVPGGPGVREAMALLHIGRVREPRRPSGEGEVGDEAPVSIALSVGSACADHAEERYARLGEGPVVCIAESALEAFFSADADELREPRLFTMSDEALTRLLVEGRTRLEVTRADERFTLTSGGEERPVDDQALADLLRDLRSVRAVAYLPADDATLRAHGLANPAQTITLEPDEGDPEVVTIGAATSAGLFARRGDEAVVVELPPEAGEVLDISSLDLRPKRLIDEDLDEATKLVVTRGRVVEELERSGAEWRVTSPVEMPADLGASRDALRAVAGLEAIRYVAEAPLPAHGLTAPRFVVDVRFERSEDEGDDGHDHEHEGEGEGGEAGDEERAEIREHAIRVGASTEGGAFAQLDDDRAVFIVPESLVAAIERPLVSRDALATELDEIARVVVERAGARVELLKTDAGYTTADGGPADGARTRALMDAIATLRADEVVAYGAPPAAAGFATPRARITITRPDTAPEPHAYTVLVGATADGARVHVKPADADVVFLVPEATVTPLLTYSP